MFSDWQPIEDYKLIPFDLNTFTLELKITATTSPSQQWVGFCVQFVHDGMVNLTAMSPEYFCIEFSPKSRIEEHNCTGENVMDHSVSNGTSFWNFTRYEDKIVMKAEDTVSSGNEARSKIPCHQTIVWLLFTRGGQITIHYIPIC